jgi:hypothetical protein
MVRGFPWQEIEQVIAHAALEIIIDDRGGPVS